MGIQIYSNNGKGIQIFDLFAECSIDYDRHSQTTRNFYATVQNKFHYAITGHTAAELIFNNADSSKDNMGLTTWKNSPEGRILKSDTTIATSASSCTCCRNGCG